MAALHPIVVHFTIVLVLLGVVFRLVSLFGRPALAFVGPAASTLLILGAIASVVAVQSGDAAHGPVERVPGSRPAVMEHEEWGERARNVAVVVGVLELLVLALRRSPKVKLVRAASAAVGVVAAFCIYEAGEHGGELVYAYAGGVGIRSGDVKDVDRLLLAGYYHKAMAERKAGQPEKAAALIVAAQQAFPADVEVKLLGIESVLLDQKNPQGAIDALATVQAPAGNAALGRRVTLLKVDAFEAAGQKDAAIAILEAALTAGANPRLQARLDKLKGSAAH